MKALVLQTDFGLGDGAVSAMEGVALGVDEDIRIHHLTHEITPYNIFEASYRLFQTVQYWPKGTVFVSVVDPGVGTSRKSVVAKTASGHYIATPDNGTLTHISKHIGIVELREISEATNRLANTEKSYTFHGRDVFVYTAARLVSGTISYEEVGPKLDPSTIHELPTYKTIVEPDYVQGAVDILDVRFGSLWTSIEMDDFASLKPVYGEKYEVTIKNGSTIVYESLIEYQRSFGDVKIGSPIIYINSLYHVAVAINQGSFAKAYGIGVGQSWTIKIARK
ncbi:MAG: S-adenosyl-l-methionine hydroxide adenosyltransferase family protein [Erysipelotrichaceae bacterium]|nr:S-adenosyl-l-methionine hydroxide adenosyltransferase family protein [Erysipelotrichaceae bacterium]